MTSGVFTGPGPSLRTRFAARPSTPLYRYLRGACCKSRGSRFDALKAQTNPLSGKARLLVRVLATGDHSAEPGAPSRPHCPCDLNMHGLTAKDQQALVCGQIYKTAIHALLDLIDVKCFLVRLTTLYFPLVFTALRARTAIWHHHSSRMSVTDLKRGINLPM